ncbi:MAG: metal ABC transporter permease, partial [Planctomycetota bacterium]
LFNPVYDGDYWPPVIATLLVALLAGPLSVLVVLKRLAFIGQGVSHSAFGGVGLAMLAAATGVGFFGASEGGRLLSPLAASIVVPGFALLSALAISRLSRSSGLDAAIGVVLAVSMAIGVQAQSSAGRLALERGLARPPSLERTLFGHVLEVGWFDVAASAAVAIAVGAALWWWRRPLLFWAFDAEGSRVRGVRGGRMRALLLGMLAIAVVVVMQVAGVVLATAMLVLPGAAALRLGRTLGPVFLWSVVLSVLGAAAGVVIGFELDLLLGPSIVAAQAVLLAIAMAAGVARGKMARGRPR